MGAVLDCSLKRVGNPAVASVPVSEAHPLSKALYGKVIFVLLGLVLLASTVRLSGFTLEGTPNTAPIDFHAFYVAAQLVWRGDIEQAYHVDYMAQFFSDYTGHKAIIPWSYPAPYNLVVAPFSLLSPTAAYVTFTSLTLAAYLATLRSLSGRNLTLVLLATFPAVIITILSGQNGFLTGTLVGLACIGLLRSQWSAGLPLGLMVIKPHLIAGLALYTVAGRRWQIVVVAALVLGATLAVATALLGTPIWAAFLGSLQETRFYLEAGLYPLHRMVSPYAAIRSLGAPAAVAFVLHAAAAVFSLAILLLAIRNKMRPNQQLGLAVVASLLVSPYAYDYDLTIYGLGLALVLPDLLRLASEREQAAIFGLSFFTAALGLANYTALALLDTSPGHVRQPSVAGITLFVLMVLIWRILRRDSPIMNARSENLVLTHC
jgi:Glycosyltransferase family 87